MERITIAATQSGFLPLAPLLDDGDLPDEYAGLLAHVLRLAGTKLERMAERNRDLRLRLKVAYAQLRPFRNASGDTPHAVLVKAAERAARADPAEAKEYVEAMVGAVRGMDRSVDRVMRTRAWRSSACRAGMYALLVPSEAAARSALLGAAMEAFPDRSATDLNDELAESWDVGKRLMAANMLADFRMGIDPETVAADLADTPAREAVDG